MAEAVPWGIGLSTWSSMNSADAGPFPPLMPDFRIGDEGGLRPTARIFLDMIALLSGLYDVAFGLGLGRDCEVMSCDDYRRNSFFEVRVNSEHY